MIRQPHRQRLIRQVRLQRLLGRSMAEIAAQVGRGASTVWRVIRDNGLDAPERPLERQRLSLSEAHDMAVDRMIAADVTPEELRALSGLIMRLAAEIRRMEMAVATWEGDEDVRIAGRANEDETGEDAEDELSPAAEQCRLDALAAGFQTKGASGGAEQRLEHAGGMGVQPGQPESVDPARPRYTGAAAGRMAELRVHGRTRRWEDAGGGRMAPLVDDSRAVSPGGAGGTRPARCARSDDRWAERAEMDRAAEVPPPTLLAQPADPEL
ncbi:MAG: hypothetical protein DBW63_13745 [Hyphomonas sp.]|nr:MAG: hypothetical protein DBW63_13745 [Hyphomonas sp.]